MSNLTEVDSFHVTVNLDRVKSLKSHFAPFIRKWYKMISRRKQILDNLLILRAKVETRFLEKWMKI